ncbi:hypothetical protein [Vibrio breoganii]|uniref:Uncharacterized protein n=1 Tax=Vibrio breoganii TaxID=553239 RepID=A0ABX1U6H6_9VIBR|nr:hypothetical protein [Vibrio breoganii]NMO71862.1 hypothetical protein [Vibrio breoganii]NMR68400.1 hypothetical protein [Vibrio breoganii]PML89343.1 hypothetical protein BCT67_08185 [Vibrio breoganii]
MSKNKPNKGHKNVDTSEEKKAAASARIEKRISILEGIVSEREANFSDMEGLPKKLTEFTDSNDWIVGSIDPESIKFGRGTYYQKWNIDRFENRLNNLFNRIKHPKKVDDKVTELTAKNNQLTLENESLMAANLCLDRKLSREVKLLKTQLEASIAANRRLQDQLNRKADVIPFTKPK